jgi:hypothetical protein
MLRCDLDHSAAQHVRARSRRHGRFPIAPSPSANWVGEQRTDDAALRRASPVALAAAHAPFPRAAPLLDRRRQPHPRALDPGAQRFRIDDPPSHVCMSSACGIVSKYFDKSASTTSA